MKIYPIDISIIDISESFLNTRTCTEKDRYQIKIQNYLINVSQFGVCECLVFNDNDEIIDGFVRWRSEFEYKGIPFSALLGGFYDTVANPIDSTIYKYIRLQDNYKHQYELRVESMKKIHT
jgi:hypothetical protein